MQNIEDSNYLKQFAQRVRTLREAQGISQEKLAERAGLHRTYIGMVERLERNPSLVCIHKIANGLGVHVTELF
ncbi:helix-turn-helix domain-containing protein [Bacteroides hominis]|uniref:XRE family transcriptional regulator n=2 Tax=Bacteroides fragilis TaxID=817 RepID=A0A412XXN6_BACFG|nr:MULTISPECIES: helix-turn-helix transcriptional regulator [Bacteroides]MBY2900511.1 transcriptional regulator [Bacteroides fragilis]MCE8614656.1 helix-turn-helix transcriptional regulator [Bacteroides fragilis]MCM0208085.1 helix-turn-helix transcriptional regulator [Bacteroides fragilis]MCM0249945.1 helix-turn-helix transcriptional regulator [Bacteroides fragilis]MCM0260419.1 helix-turn-helix transcriptional regulator [Bacteroides fragilis]